MVVVVVEGYGDGYGDGKGVRQGAPDIIVNGGKKCKHSIR
jgi:hypothetical protein